jgi:DNA mismatch repair protein MutS
MTPLMQQYWEIKSAHADKIVLFRMGDFFEMFHADAEKAAPILGIALTQRNKKSADETPMCGVPHHSIGGQINKLLSAGLKVAICDQLEDPKQAKGIVKRGVTRVLSPGLVYDPDTLDALAPNYLASFDQESVAFLDVTTFEAFYYFVRNPDERARILRILHPVELILDSQQSQEWEKNKRSDFEILLTTHDSLTNQSGLPKAALRLLSYTQAMQGLKTNAATTPTHFELRELLDRLELGPTAIRHLEIFETYKGEQRGSLFFAVNRCKTSSGARLLKNWLAFPLSRLQAIEERSAHVQFYFEQQADLKELRAELAHLGDIERRLGKITNPTCNPRDLLALSYSLQTGVRASQIVQKMKPLSKNLPKNLSAKLNSELLQKAQALAQKISQTLVDEPPVQMKNGHMIRAGVHPLLDEWIDLSLNSQSLLTDLENRERTLTGISSLKVRFNSVFGYYIEITNTHKDKVPKDRYERKQTLANAERYLTPELAEIEQKVLTAQSRRIELELEIFESLRSDVLKASIELLQLAREWSELDALSALAWLALEQNYVRPQFSAEGHLHLKASRHPVVEQALRHPFVANDIEIHAHHCLLLTGPNMAGKSTLMRQVAISALMAQIGSFVPAAQAVLPLFDRIFTRIGASDFLSEGLSTFMVEMQETADMLKLATPHSLVILDEVGRGTSTYDGMSLAQAILEYLLTTTQAMTLFATHYHELTALETRFAQVQNAHMSIREKDGVISFLHALLQGAASKSYGIHVAELAGLPSQVTQRAQVILAGLEAQSSDKSVAETVTLVPSLVPAAYTQMQMSFAHPQADELLQELQKLNTSDLTPLQALNWLAEKQARLRS